jgi:hypothetical protein
VSRGKEHQTKKVVYVNGGEHRFPRPTNRGQFCGYPEPNLFNSSSSPPSCAKSAERYERRSVLMTSNLPFAKK